MGTMPTICFLLVLCFRLQGHFFNFHISLDMLNCALLHDHFSKRANKVSRYISLWIRALSQILN
jgi:hypothetical protein